MEDYLGYHVIHPVSNVLTYWSLMGPRIGPKWGHIHRISYMESSYYARAYVKIYIGRTSPDLLNPPDHPNMHPLGEPILTPSARTSRYLMHPTDPVLLRHKRTRTFTHPHTTRTKREPKRRPKRDPKEHLQKGLF